MNEIDLVQTLINAGVSDGRIYPIEAPSSAIKPYTIYTKMNSSFIRDLHSDVDFRHRYSFTSWCETYEQANQLILNFRTVLAGIGYMAGSSVISKDPDTDSFRILNNDWYINNTE